MTSSHGRVGRGGRPWFATALAASGLLLAAPAGRPALACHIHHHGTTTHAAAESPTMPPSTALPAPVKELNDQVKAAVIAPTSMTIPTPTATPTPAAQVLTPASAVAPTVHDWHKTTSSACTPPPPTCTCQASTTAAAQAITPPAPASHAPLAVQVAATPAPEPSTILSAVAILGAVAWRRRAARARA